MIASGESLRYTLHESPSSQNLLRFVFAICYLCLVHGVSGSTMITASSTREILPNATMPQEEALFDHMSLLQRHAANKLKHAGHQLPSSSEHMYDTRMVMPTNSMNGSTLGAVGILQELARSSMLSPTVQGSLKFHTSKDASSDATTRLLVAIIAVVATCACVWVLLILAEASGPADEATNSKCKSSSRTTAASPTPMPSSSPLRAAVWDLLEGRTPVGRKYESVIVLLILATIVSFMLGSLQNQTYNVDPATGQYIGPSWSKSWDFYVFGIGDELVGTSVFEIAIVAVFSADYILRLWAVVEEPEYDHSRMQFVFSFFSIVDLMCIAPFYVEIATPITDIPASEFLRTLRLLRMMSVEARYAEAFTLFDDVLVENRKLLATSSFVGIVVWLMFAGFYYLTERRNPQMIYCPRCPSVKVELCRFDAWGVVSCSGDAGCESECWNLFQSIPGSMYFTLVNLFGEFPLTDRQSTLGMVAATVVAVVAVFVFAIPTGILGSGFVTLLKRKRDTQDQVPTQEDEQQPAAAELAEQDSSDTLRAKVYAFVNGKTAAGAMFESFTFFLIILSTLTFFIETCDTLMASSPSLFRFLEGFELFTVIVFTVEFAARIYSIGEEQQYEGWWGLCAFLTSFFAIVDLLSILPYWIQVALVGRSQSSMFLRSLRLLRMFKTERYVEAFTVFDDVLRAQSDVLLVTGFAAFVLWVLFSVLMYLSERDNPDEETVRYYRTIPDSMWVTLLNLSGECPIVFYSPIGQVITGIMGLFAVGFVGIPIGILGAGFQDWVEAKQRDTPDKEASSPIASAQDAEDAEEDSGSTAVDQDMQMQVRDFIEARTFLGSLFEIFIFVLIFVTILIAILGTLPALQCDDIGGVSLWCSVFNIVEGVATLTFTAEYAMRLFAAQSRLEFIFSFYSLVDLLAIVPWYIAKLNPGGWVNQHDGTFRIFRILRLFKLDKYVPSLTLVDDVFRLKRNSLSVTGIVAGIIWILFGSLLFLAEKDDKYNEIDPMPLQGCLANCTESARYQNAFAAMPFAMIHLTGDYPIIEYNWSGRILCMVMVLVGVGVVSIPSGVIADGFKQVVSEKTKLGAEKLSALRDYDIALAALGDTPAPREFTSDAWDTLQCDCNTLLNGVPSPDGCVQRSLLSWCLNRLTFVLIISNVLLALIESMPVVSRAASSGVSKYFFQGFEAFTVAVFTIEYVLRLFSVTKDKQHLYSRWCYVTTFFGVVDLLAILPWYIQLLLAPTGEDMAAVFRMLRLFRLLELEHFVVAFTVLDNVFRTSRGIFIATGLMALAIWVTSAGLFYLFEHENPNWCTQWADAACSQRWTDGCICTERLAFSSIPNALYFVAIFLGGEWAMVDFTLPGKLLCIVLCLVGIAIYAVPVGTLFDSFGAVLEDGLEALEDDDEDN